MKIRIVQNAPFPRITQFTFSVDRLRKLAVVACEFPRGALSPILTCNASLRIRELAILADAARDCIVRNTKFSRDTVGAYSVRKQRGVCGDELAGGANGPLRTGREPETCELASLADGALDGVVRGTKFSLDTFGFERFVASAEVNISPWPAKYPISLELPVSEWFPSTRGRFAWLRTFLS